MSLKTKKHNLICLHFNKDLISECQHSYFKGQSIGIARPYNRYV